MRGKFIRVRAFCKEEICHAELSLLYFWNGAVGWLPLHKTARQDAKFT
jgi:hypothetical protein